MRRAAWSLFAVGLSAVLLVLVLPPADVGPLGFVCLVPLPLAVHGRGLAYGFVCGMAALVLAAFVTQTGWFYRPSLIGESAGWNYTGFALFGAAVGGTCAIAGETKRTDRWTPWLWTAWAVLFEAVLLFKLPAHLALTQYRNFAAVRLSSVTGIWGVSFLVWSVNIHLARALKERNNTALAVCGAIAGLAVGIGALTGTPREGTFKVGVVQTKSADFDELAVLNAKASERGAQIVVWPELSAVAAVRHDDTSRLVALARQRGQSPFVTSFEDDASPMPHNAAALFSFSGESERYWKRKPFGGESSEHAAGTRAVAVRAAGATCGLNICFDSCFPSVIRDTANLDGVNLVLLPTQDPVAPYGTIQALHAAYTPFRAAESGVPIVRADTTAYSMVVDARGAIVAELGSGTEDVMVTGINLERRDTLYRRFGDWFLYLCAALATAGMVVSRRSVARPSAANE